MANRLMQACAFSVLFLAAASVSAQAVLSDPTRPPAGIAVGGAGGAESEELTGPVLQSVLIPRKGKPVAVIGGKQVRLGERYGESRLIKLTEREAVLEGPGGIERLRLTPGVEKTNLITKNVTNAPAAKRAQSGSKP